MSRVISKPVRAILCHFPDFTLKNTLRRVGKFARLCNPKLNVTRFQFDINRSSNELMKYYHDRYKSSFSFSSGSILIIEKTNYFLIKGKVVISGISGRFPESRNVEEFWKNLIDGVDLVTADDRRWPQGFAGLPNRKGTLKNDLEEFDAEFFSVSRPQAERLDPQLRQLLEVSWEAILDAGFNPIELRGRPIGVYVGATTQETFEACRANRELPSRFDVLGNVGGMFANRISFAFDLRGPSFMIDALCSSSIVAFNTAVNAIISGECEGAIVAGISLLLDPLTSLQLKLVGVLAPDGKCKSFDASGDGYVRSETIAAVYITKESLARRSYATVVNTKINTDGFKENGLTFPSATSQEMLMRQTYEEAGVCPKDVCYVEAHGTGTVAGDGQELSAITSVFCSDRPASSPLLIGSTKSNMGHAESAANIASLIKLVLSIQHGVIPPNIHYNTPNQSVPALLDGRLKVVTEVTKLTGQYFGLSGSGLGGVNGHIILQSPLPKQRYSSLELKNRLPILVPFSSRTKYGVQEALKLLEHEYDERSVQLLHKVHELPISNHDFRGYAICGEGFQTKSHVNKVNRSEKELWFIFPGTGTQWAGMGKEIMQNDIIRNSIETSATFVQPFGVDLVHLLIKGSQQDLDLHKSLVCTAVTIALTDLFSCLNLAPSGLIGHSAGEIICAYMDDCLTHREAILTQFYKDTLLNELESNGAMAAVGLTWEEAIAQCPPKVYAACHNAHDNVTISGLQDDITEFVGTLRAKNIFAKMVTSGGAAYHSPYVKPIVPKYTQMINESVKGQRPTSKKWISTCRNPDDYENSTCDTSFSADDLIVNLLSPVYFHSAIKQIPSDAIVVEIGSHSLFQSILRRTLPPSATIIPTMRRDAEDNLSRIYNAVGLLFAHGFQPKISSLYPQSDKKLMVGNSKTSISSMVEWDHSQKFPLLKYYNNSMSEHVTKVSLADEKWSFLEGHKIDGRILFPAAGYLVLVWKVFGERLGKTWEKTSVKFQNVKIHQATIITNHSTVEFFVNIFQSTGEFQVTESGVLVVSGKIFELETLDDSAVEINPSSSLELKQKDIYKDLRLRGYQYTGQFQTLMNTNVSGSCASLLWHPDWTVFLDSLVQLVLLSWPQSSAGISVPTTFKAITIQPQFFESMEIDASIAAKYCLTTKSVSTTGVTIDDIKFSSAPRKRTEEVKPLVHDWQFIPYFSDADQRRPFFDALKICTDIFLENTNYTSVVVTEVCDDSTKLECSILEQIGDIVAMYPQRKIFQFERPSDLVVFHTLEAIKNCRKTEITDNGFGMLLTETEESGEFWKQNLPSWTLVSKQATTNLSILLFRKTSSTVIDSEVVIPIQNGNYSWLPKLQTLMANSSPNARIWLTSDDPETGLVGLVNCLRLEDGGDIIRCLISPRPIVTEEIKMADLVMNVFDPTSHRRGSYRCLPLDSENTHFSAHAYLNVLQKGDLSSVKWIEDTILEPKSNQIPCIVHYTSLNFRDIMLATALLSPDALPGDTARSEYIFGLEFVGVDTSHDRKVMGIVGSKGLATHVLADPEFLWTVPEQWTMSEAATVPIAFSTAYYALIMRGKLQKFDSILITYGSGGVGQAAMAVAFALNCEIFTTVSSPEKKKWLLNRFPNLKENHIFSLRNTKFSKEILKLTNGRGVDVVLNSLSEEKLQAALSCIADGGRFLEIGKFDLSHNTTLGMEVFLRNISFHGILLDALFSDAEPIVAQKRQLVAMVQEGIDSGVVQPLPKAVFDHKEAEEAFRFMASGKHSGKIVLRMRQESEHEPLLEVTPRVYFSSKKVYVLFGGLGGLGLELASWMICRGVKNLAFVSRSGITNGYQQLQISRWKESGVNVVVVTKDLEDTVGAEELLEALSTHGSVGGIFNLAMVLLDGLFENQTVSNFEQVMKPKQQLTKLLDEATRKVCPELDYFVTFCSATSLFGNAGQSSYSYANSSMARICEYRKRDGLPALCIAPGPIGDVGVAHEHLSPTANVGGVIPQPLSSCLQVFETFLHPNFKSTLGIVSTVLFPSSSQSTAVNTDQNTTVKQKIGRILGLTEETFESNTKISLIELGLDSFMVTEIKQILQELNLGKTYSASEIRNFTLEKLEEFSTHQV